MKRRKRININILHPSCETPSNAPEVQDRRKPIVNKEPPRMFLYRQLWPQGVYWILWEAKTRGMMTKEQEKPQWISFVFTFTHWMLYFGPIFYFRNSLPQILKNFLIWTFVWLFNYYQFTILSNFTNNFFTKTIWLKIMLLWAYLFHNIDYK